MALVTQFQYCCLLLMPEDHNYGLPHTMPARVDNCTLVSAAWMLGVVDGPVCRPDFLCQTTPMGSHPSLDQQESVDQTVIGAAPQQLWLYE